MIFELNLPLAFFTPSLDCHRCSWRIWGLQVSHCRRTRRSAGTALTRVENGMPWPPPQVLAMCRRKRAWVCPSVLNRVRCLLTLSAACPGLVWVRVVDLLRLTSRSRSCQRRTRSSRTLKGRTVASGGGSIRGWTGWGRSGDRASWRPGHLNT